MKKIRLTLDDIFSIPTAIIYNPDSFETVSAVSIDSRNVKPGSLFVAIDGEKFDGHNFVNDAIKKGAVVVLISEKKKDDFNGLKITFITVKNTKIALGDIAKIWRNKLNIKVIGITGSSGKTSIKEFLSTVLSERYKVNKTIANNNNHIGVPLTILDTNEKHQILITELGTNHFGEIAYSANIAKPDYAVITNIGDTHLEYFKNKKGVLREKIELFKAAMENNGTLFINNDDPLLKNVFQNYPKRITYGFNYHSTAQGKVVGFTDLGKYIIEFKYKNKTLKFTCPLYGEYNAKNILAVATVSFYSGINKNEFLRSLKKLKPIEKRLNVNTFQNFIIIDDTYNANPDSMKYAIELIGRMNAYNRKILILGDMFELGENAVRYHEKLALIIKRQKIDEVYSIGTLMKNLHMKLENMNILSRHFKVRKSLTNFINMMDFTNSIILVKGSRGMKMEDFVNVIKSGVKK